MTRFRWTWQSAVGFVGHPFIALLLAPLLAWYVLGIRRGFKVHELSALLRQLDSVSISVEPEDFYDLRSLARTLEEPLIDPSVSSLGRGKPISNRAGIFLLRGLGVCVYTHALYNVGCLLLSWSGNDG